MRFSRLTLDIAPTFEIAQSLYEDLPLTAVAEDFEAIFSSAYSVSLFTDWRGPRFNQVWLKRRVDSGEAALEPQFFGATPALAALHPIAGWPAENCTAQGGAPGAWYERLPHFRLEFLASSGEELQSEYFVPREHAVEALFALDGIRERIAPLLQVSEIRTVAADDLYMSPCFEQASVCLHFTWFRDWPAVRQLLPKIEEVLAPFRARPHWGKMTTLSPSAYRALYPKLPAFAELRETFDPEGKFRNAYVAGILAV
jgi:xylitol oxidase